MMIPLFILFIISTSIASTELTGSIKTDRHLPTSSCSKLQYSIQKSILSTNYGLESIKFQQRLKRHPNYIVTIGRILSTHDPLIELRCPIGQEKLEIYFHESRFSAENVRLFDINSIFPIHQGQLNVRIKLSPLIIVLDSGTDLTTNLKSIHYSDHVVPMETVAKEHRTEDETLNDPLEKEIQDILVKRIQPDVAKVILAVVRNSTNGFLNSNSVRF